MAECQPIKAYEGKPWRWEENGCTVTRTTAWTAPGCHEGCQLYVYADENGKLVKVEGDPDSPFNQGRLCPRCLCIDEVLYHPDRIVHPMKRPRSSRGDNSAWEQCSWEEALDICEENYRAISEKYGADTIHFQRGTGRDIMWQTGRLAYAIGSPNEYGAQSGTSCYVPRLSQMILTMGGQMLADESAHLVGRYEDPNYVLPACIVVWGCNPMNSNPDFQLGHWIVECMKRGTKIITVDPRITFFAARSEVHLDIRPGTDGALAMGLVHVIIEEDLYDHDFVDCWTFGFEQLAERVREWTPEHTAEVCWVDADKIRAAARLFAASKPANVYWGVAVDMQASGVGAAQGIEALWTITGNVDIPGGMSFTRPPYGITQDMGGGWGMDTLLTDEQRSKRCGVQKYPMYSFGIAHASPDEALLAAEAGRMKGLWIQTTNTLAGMGDEVERWKKVMTEVEFCAVVDLFMTPTASLCADVFLPVACWPERMGFRAYYYDVSTINPCIKPVGEVKSDAEINRLLGRRFSKEAWPWESEEELYDEILRPTGMTWAQLRDHGPLYPPYEYEKFKSGHMRPDGQPGFMTPTGRIELYSNQLERMGYDPLPNFQEPARGPVSAPEDFEKYPFILMTGARSPQFFHTEHRQVPHLRQFCSDPHVQINPSDAERLHINDGQWVWLENELGRCRQRAEVTSAVRPGTILGQHGWWYPERSGDAPNPFGVFDVNINPLIRNAPGVTGFGADRKCVLCRIVPIEGGDL